MTFLRNIWADLVEKRLWPVAAALAVALVAIPVALGRSGSGSAADGATGAVPATAATPASTAQVVTYAQPTKGHLVGGRARDPFNSPGARPKHVATTAAAAPAPASTATGGSSASSPAPTSSGVSAPAVTAPTVSTGPGPNVVAPPAPGTPAGYRVDVSWGPAGGTASANDLPRLTPLKADGAPTLIFLGVKEDGHTAVFLLAGSATPTGDGRCLPSAKRCQTIELRQGESEFFDVTTGDAGVVQYELDVDAVAVKHAAGTAAAAQAKARVSKAGRAALRAAIDSGRVGYIGHYQYSARRGVLVVHKTAHAASARDLPLPVQPTW